MNSLKKYQRFVCTAVLLLVAVAVCLLAGAIWSRWENHIYLPTYFTKIDDQYFIVDAGHYRVLYSDDVKKPIFRWKTLDTDFYNPHSLAGHDGTLVADDTLNSRLKVYRRQGDDWTLSQIIPIADSGYPHFTAYDVDYGGGIMCWTDGMTGCMCCGTTVRRWKLKKSYSCRT